MVKSNMETKEVISKEAMDISSNLLLSNMEVAMEVVMEDLHRSNTEGMMKIKAIGGKEDLHLHHKECKDSDKEHHKGIISNIRIVLDEGEPF